MSEPAAFGLLVVTHGRLAEELVAAAHMIVGDDVGGLAAVALAWDSEVEQTQRRIEQGLAAVDRGRGVLILTDMFGGTPTNVALSLLEAGRIEIVTGVNLPMLIKFVNLRADLALDELAGRIADCGRESIQVASGLLGRGPAHPPEGRP